jgi:tetratricopeptide (TPR) repeat protein
MVRQFPGIVLALFLGGSCATLAQEFDFSWEQETQGAVGSSAPKKAADAGQPGAVPAGGSGFSFSWEGGEPVTNAGQRTVGGGQRAAGVVRAPVADPEAEALRRKNAELQRRIAELSAGKQSAEGEVEKLGIKLRALAKQVTDSSTTITELRKQLAQIPTGTDVAKQADLEARLETAVGEKGKLSDQVAMLKKRVEDLRGRPREVPVTPVGPRVQPGSDLYRDLETRHARLKEQLARLEADKKAADEAREKALAEEARIRKAKEDAAALAASLEEKLEAALAGSGKRATLVRRLNEEMPELEKQLAELKKGVAAREVALTEKDRAMQDMKAELDRRDYRLRKAERMAQLLEQARREVAQKNSAEKRDMHFNMGVTYARDGRFRAAEREYLRALEIDPADADVHYNLGILYDENLKRPRRAALHYRRYLRLRPHARDRDQVRGWLDTLELNR